MPIIIIIIIYIIAWIAIRSNENKKNQEYYESKREFNKKPEEETIKILINLKKNENRRKK